MQGNETQYRDSTDTIFGTLQEALSALGWQERASDGLWTDPDGEGPLPIIEALEQADLTEVRPFKHTVVMTQSVTFEVTVLAADAEESESLLVERAGAGDYDAEADEVAGQTDGWQLGHFEPAEEGETSE